MEIDWTNYDVNLLQHEVPLSDMRLVLVLVNPSKGYLSIPYYFKLVKLFLRLFHELK